MSNTTIPDTDEPLIDEWCLFVAAPVDPALVGVRRALARGASVELGRDDTATGRRQAAIARAARPSLEAKDLAWAEMMERTDIPNAILEATIGGFVQPDQVDLLSHFRTRFFDDIVRAWDAQTMEMGQSLAMGLYPSLIVDAKTVRETDDFLRRDDLNPALRRLVIEGRDGVSRSLRARAADA